MSTSLHMFSASRPVLEMMDYDYYDHDTNANSTTTTLTLHADESLGSSSSSNEIQSGKINSTSSPSKISFPSDFLGILLDKPIVGAHGANPGPRPVSAVNQDSRALRNKPALLTPDPAVTISHILQPTTSFNNIRVNTHARWAKIPNADLVSSTNATPPEAPAQQKASNVKHIAGRTGVKIPSLEVLSRIRRNQGIQIVERPIPVKAVPRQPVYVVPVKPWPKSSDHTDGLPKQTAHVTQPNNVLPKPTASIAPAPASAFANPPTHILVPKSGEQKQSRAMSVVHALYDAYVTQKGQIHSQSMEMACLKKQVADLIEENNKLRFMPTSMYFDDESDFYPPIAEFL